MDVQVASTFFALLAFAALIGSGLLAYALATGRGLELLDPTSATALAWLVAATCVGGSLYYSEVVGFEPCLFCWWQRIAMYPLVVILGVAALRRDAEVWRYGLPLSAAGFGLAAYHYFIQHFPDVGGGACSASVPCTAAYVWEFGFVSIPFMAGAGFLSTSLLLLVARRTAP